MATYRERTGVTTFIFIVSKLCRLFVTYQTKIIGWVNASSLVAGDKAIVIAWINAASGVCSLLRLIGDD